MADAPRTFVFEKGGVKITAPYFEDVMTADFFRRYRKSSEVEQMFALVESALDEENLAEFGKLKVFRTPRDGEDAVTMDEFYSAWQADAGITLGE
jgi:hypothetical protein